MLLVNDGVVDLLFFVFGGLFRELLICCFVFGGS